MRKRNKSITFRMNSEEYTNLQDKLAECGLPQQTYILQAISGATVTSAEEIAILREISAIFADYDRQLRGLATNVNQMTRIANGYGNLPSEHDLNRILSHIQNYRMEMEELWRSTRLLTTGHPHTQH